jgi:3-phenylpropionate/trans-cinnamate dioxygenase ferredoxin reductase subunit
MATKKYRYLIIGGGMTAESAVRGIREVDPDGSIGLISAEPHPPYNRPPLSKSLWKGDPEPDIWLDLSAAKLDLHLGRWVQRIDPGHKLITDDENDTYTYDRLLLATGGSPRRLPFGDDQIIYYRTLDDYRRLRELTGAGKRFAVIGGGFIGSEVAAALAMNRQSVTMAFPEEGIGRRVFPRDLSLFLNEYFRERGVDIRPGVSVDGLSGGDAALTVHIAGGTGIPADGVVAGIGIQPDVELARDAGLAVDNGIIVDEDLQASHPDIYAAGDVASFPSFALGRRVRVEHEDAARTMGAAAGRAMAGRAVPYRHLPSFYSDLFDLGYEAVGLLDSRLDTIADWKEPFREGVVYYLEAGRVRGVLLWNVWGQVDAARSLIESAGLFEPGDLRGRLPA